MTATKVSLDCNRISDWRSFHEEFANAFGFPAFYGKNMNAWIDCMTDVDDPVAGMSTIHCDRGSVLVLELLNVKTFRQRYPELYEAVIDGVAFVNWRRLEIGDQQYSRSASGNDCPSSTCRERAVGNTEVSPPCRLEARHDVTDCAHLS